MLAILIKLYNLANTINKKPGSMKPFSPPLIHLLGHIQVYKNICNHVTLYFNSMRYKHTVQLYNVTLGGIRIGFVIA